MNIPKKKRNVVDINLHAVQEFEIMKSRKPESHQYDLFGYMETDDNKLHRLKCEQEKIRRSFFARYNLVIKELDAIQAELDDLTLKMEKKHDTSLCSIVAYDALAHV